VGTLSLRAAAAPHGAELPDTTMRVVRRGLP
jgi:hypothetical protein